MRILFKEFEGSLGPSAVSCTSLDGRFRSLSHQKARYIYVCGSEWHKHPTTQQLEALLEDKRKAAVHFCVLSCP